MKMIDWENIREECSKNNKVIKVPKVGKIDLPPDFHEANLGISKGAIRQYRDEKATYSLHVHEFEDHFLAHVDTFNPEYHPLAHGIVDTPGMTLGIVTGAIALYCVMKKAKNLNFFAENEWEE